MSSQKAQNLELRQILSNLVKCAKPFAAMLNSDDGHFNQRQVWSLKKTIERAEFTLNNKTPE